jgi:rhodanese-related sulfurtransferase
MRPCNTIEWCKIIRITIQEKSVISFTRQSPFRLSAIALLSLFVFTSLPAFAEPHKRVDAKTAAKMIEAGSIDMILDVRDMDEFTGPDGRIKGAMLVPNNQIPASMDKLASFREKTVLVYCAVGGRSDHAARYLSSNGFKNVLDLAGGVMAWKSAGLPVIR